MAAKTKLEPCPDCNASISRLAPLCLHCGREMRLSLPRVIRGTIRVARRALFAYAVIGLSILVIVWIVASLQTWVAIR